jgi:hypothetical protein
MEVCPLPAPKSETKPRTRKSATAAAKPEETVKPQVLRTYEALIVLKPILDVDNSDNVLKSIEDMIEGLGGSVSKKESWAASAWRMKSKNSRTASSPATC